MVDIFLTIILSFFRDFNLVVLRFQLTMCTFCPQLLLKLKTFEGVFAILLIFCKCVC